MDIALVYDPLNFDFDIKVVGGDLMADDGMETAIILSPFLDARADPDDLLPLDPPPVAGLLARDPRGWWGDWYVPGTPVRGAPSIAAPPTDRIGSKLWLLARSKELPSTLRQVEEYCEAALQWMIDNEIASSVDVAAEITAPGMCGFAVEIAKPAGPRTFHFDVVWGAPG